MDGEDFNHLLWVMFRGSGKTTALACWLAKKIAANRDFRGLVISVDDDKATEIVDFTRKNLEAPQMIEWFTPFESRRLWSMDAFEVLGRSRAFREPTLTAAGIRSFRPGGHYNVIVVDDGEDDAWTDSAEKMENTRRRDALLAPMCDVQESLRVTSSTVWNDMDLSMSYLRAYGLMKEERQKDGSLKRIIRNGSKTAIRLPSGGDYKVQVFYKPVEEDGAPLFPRFRSADWIAAKRFEMRLQPDQFAANFLLDPMPVENTKFPPEVFRFVEVLPKDVRGDLWCGGDFASSLKPGSDHTALVVCLVTEDFKWFILEAFSRRMDGREAIETLFTLHKSYPGLRFALEEDRYMAGLKLLLEEEMRKRRMLLDIEWINAHARTKKDSRVEAMEPLFKMGAVTFLTGMADPLYDSLRRHPKGRKDLADALANAYEKAQSAPPAKKEALPVDEDWLQVYGRPRIKSGDIEAVPSPQQLRRIRSGEVNWRQL